LPTVPEWPGLFFVDVFGTANHWTSSFLMHHAAPRNFAE
jgi:hypothetical protein